MSRKDFELIAKVIRESDDLVDATRALADAFTEQNPRFDRYRFMEACGVFDE